MSSLLLKHINTHAHTLYPLLLYHRLGLLQPESFLIMLYHRQTAKTTLKTQLGQFGLTLLIYLEFM